MYCMSMLTTNHPARSSLAGLPLPLPTSTTHPHLPYGYHPASDLERSTPGIFDDNRLPGPARALSASKRSPSPEAILVGLRASIGLRAALMNHPDRGRGNRLWMCTRWLTTKCGMLQCFDGGSLQAYCLGTGKRNGDDVDRHS